MKLTPIKVASITAFALLSYVWFLNTHGASASFSTYVIVGIVSAIAYYITQITQAGR